MPVFMFLTAAAAVSVRMERVDLVTGHHVPVTIATRPVASTEADRGDAASTAPAWPTSPPPLVANHAGFSPLYRARDVLDIEHWPARAAAKLFRLRADGSREGSACTAEFVGPRQLVTAGHCLVDVATGQPHAGYDLAIGYDAGRGVGVPVRVTRAWIPPTLLQPMVGQTARVTPTQCDDYAVIEIAAPPTVATGWLAMRDRAPVAAADVRLLYRYSYPNQSATVTLSTMRDRTDTPPPVRAALDAAIAKARATEPDFSPDNLYFDYGRADDAAGLYIAERGGGAVPGRSGSALLDETGAIVALMSRSYGGTTYSCRLDSAAIGTIKAIVDQPS